MKGIKVFLVALISCMVIGLTMPKVEAATKLSLVELKAKFPEGKYWNHSKGSSVNPDKWTSSACNHHSSSCDYYGKCGCNSYDGAIQCMGFAYKLGYDAFGSSPRNWTTYEGTKAKNYLNNSLKPGDVVRYSGHSIFVIKVSGTTVYFGDCNSDRKCIIKWSRTIKKSEIISKGLTNVKVAPSTLKTDVTYTVTYDANGGTGGSSATYKAGNSITLPLATKVQKTGSTLKGYYFYREADKTYSTNNGWQTQANIDKNGYTKKLFAAGSTHTVNTSWTSDPANQNKFKFIAVWDDNTFTVKYVPNDGREDEVSDSVKFNTSFTIRGSDTFSKTGYELKGWNVCRKSAASTTYYVSGVGWFSDSDIKAKGYTKKLYIPQESFTLTASAWLSNSPVYNDSVFEFQAIWEKEEIPVSEVQLDILNLKLEKDNTYQLGATIVPSNAGNKTITWKSSDPAVVTVVDGKVTAVSKGNAIITAETSNGKMAACAVTVYDNITRIYGEDRYETAFKVADEFKKTLGKEKFDTVIVSSGTNFADALAGSYLSAKKDAPIIMTGVEEYQMKTAYDYIKANVKPGGTVYILGGTAAIGQTFENGLSGYKNVRLAGETRYETNLAILKEAGVKNEEIVVCTGTNFADSLSASAAGLPILLVSNELMPIQKEYLKSLSGNSYTIVGGVNAVSTALEKQLKTYGKTTRLAGETRYETSVMVAERYFEKPKKAVLAYAMNFPDGLSGGPLAHVQGAPLILTDSEYMNYRAAETYAKSKGITGGYVLGGSGLIADGTVRTVFGMSSNEEIIAKK